MIKFLGKEGWKSRRTPGAAALTAATPEITGVVMAPVVKHTEGAFDLWELPGDKAGIPGRFKSPPLSAAEMDAVELGFEEA